jgi:hypothetical protein
MAKRKKRIDPDDPLRELEQTFRRLDHEQGTVARRNARAAVFAELRRLRAWVDSTYPSKTTRKAKRKPKTVKQLEQEGWVSFSGNISPRFAAAGITPKLVKTERGNVTMLPEWAVEMVRGNATITALKKAKRSVSYRKEVLMEKRLRERRESSNLSLVQGRRRSA